MAKRERFDASKLERWLRTGDGREDLQPGPHGAGIFVPEGLQGAFERKMRDHLPITGPIGRPAPGLLFQRILQLPNEWLGAGSWDGAIMPALARSFGAAGAVPETGRGLQLRRAPVDGGIELWANYPASRNPARLTPYLGGVLVGQAGRSEVW